MILHHAPWVLPVARPVLADGAVAAADGRIRAVGDFAELKKQYPGAAVREHSHQALMPALINAHIHLELSHLPPADPHHAPEHFTAWIAELLNRRNQLGTTGKPVENAARMILAQQYQSGVIALGDIGNTDTADNLGDDFPGLLFHFREFLGLSPKTVKKLMVQLADEPDTVCCTAHAPYSTHADLIVALKRRCRRLGHLFPIHVAESGSENQLISSSSGELKDFLQQRGFWDDACRTSEIDNSGSVQYLDQLGILDEQTMCVHCVHVSRDDVQLIAARGTKICLCPGSNRFLGVGRAPVQSFLEKGILPAIGTDSSASNPEISIWREMRLLREDHPALDPADIIAMATVGGALTLGIDQDYGTLAQGKRARFLAVPVPDHTNTSRQLLNDLVADNASIQPIWI